MRLIVEHPTKTPIVAAESEGFQDGLRNRHWIKQTYRTSGQYIAWLNGWRRGQMKRKEQVVFQ